MEYYVDGNMPIPINYNLSKEGLRGIKLRVESGTETKLDLEKINFFSSNVFHKDYLLSKIRENNFLSVEDYCKFKLRNAASSSIRRVKGTLLGIIFVLEAKIK